MRELLTRTGDYGCPAAEIVAAGPPRHARVIYLCAPAARPHGGQGAGGARQFRRADRDPPAAARRRDARADPAQGRAGPLRRGAPSGRHTTPPSRRGPVIRRWLSLIAVRAALRAIGRVLRIAIIAALIIAAAPASVVAAIGAVLAWLRGWPPARLYRAALWCLPMVAVWLAATAIASRSRLGGGVRAVSRLAVPVARRPPGLRR